MMPAPESSTGRLLGEDIRRGLGATACRLFEHDRFDILPRQQRAGQYLIAPCQRDADGGEDEGFAPAHSREQTDRCDDRHPTMPMTNAHMRRLMMISHGLRPSSIVAVTT
jgi:hypothetical protein